jgi:hypothetical protein
MNTELVATFQPDGEPGWLAAVIEHSDLPEPFASELDGWDVDDLEGAIATITIGRKPVGYVAALPEFEGW